MSKVVKRIIRPITNLFGGSESRTQVQQQQPQQEMYYPQPPVYEIPEIQFPEPQPYPEYPEIPEPEVMPVPDDEAIAQDKARRRAEKRKGRTSTLLSQQSGMLQ